jgi:hypothetical protein
MRVERKRFSHASAQSSNMPIDQTPYEFRYVARGACSSLLGQSNRQSSNTAAAS